jgi:SLOG cluster2
MVARWRATIRRATSRPRAARGPWPGIVEEVARSCAARQPVYLAGLLGGAAELLGAFLIGGESPAALRQALAGAPLAEVYARRAALAASGLADGDLQADAIVELLAADTAGSACARTA